jgi:hypothetical protein
MRFRVRKYRVKVKWWFKSHSSQNPIRWKEMNLIILGRMVIDIIITIENNTYENILIRMTKNHHPSKGEKGKLG